MTSEDEYRLICWQLERDLIDAMGWDKYIEWRQINVVGKNAMTYEQYSHILQNALDDVYQLNECVDWREFTTQLRRG